MPDGLLKILVVVATAAVIFVNWLSTTGAIGGYLPNVVSAMYPTLITPAGYAFAIWGLIYTGIVGFTVAQLFNSNSESFKNIRLPYIFTCIANITWIFLWHNLLIVAALFAILALLGFLAILNFEKADKLPIIWRAVFGIYFGWVTAASIVNFRIAIMANGVDISPQSDLWFACGLIVFAAVIGILVNLKLNNAAYPVTIVWALVAIAVKQSGVRLIGICIAVSIIALMISALSFIFRKPQPA